MESIKVLIVDDNDVVLEFTRAAFSEDEGIDIIATAHNGIEAIEKNAFLGPDVILMDIEMPALSGIDATRIIKRHYPKVKVVMYSSLLEDEEKLSKARLFGASGFVQKPASAADLAGAVRQAFWEDSINNVARLEAS